MIDLQNRDGGMPTFCRGWGKLPFDRSSPDITAHALAAILAWRDDLAPDVEGDADRERDADGALRKSVARTQEGLIRYLVKSQRADGAWVSLWFGNQQEPRQENPIHGTSRVLCGLAYADHRVGEVAEIARAGRRFLLGVQQSDGSFGVSSAIEETAWAIEGLLAWSRRDACDDREALLSSAQRAASWLAEATQRGTRFAAAPVGLYFAKLWYAEQLYPILTTVAALGLLDRCLAESDERESSPCPQAN